MNGFIHHLCCSLDPPRGEEFWIPTDPRFTHAVDLVRYIKTSDEYKDYFCVGVAGSPSP